MSSYHRRFNWVGPAKLGPYQGSRDDATPVVLPKLTLGKLRHPADGVEDQYGFRHAATLELAWHKLPPVSDLK